MQRPVVLVPGIGGSILVRRDAPYKQVGNRHVVNNRWVHLTPFLRDSLAEWKRDMHYTVLRDPDPRQHGRILGLRDYDLSQVTAHDVGGVDGIRNLVRDFEVLPRPQQQLIDRLYSYQYFNEMVESLVGLSGYQERANLFGVPYDFRLVLDPGYRDGLFRNFRSVLELAVENNHGRGAVVVAHSLGVLMFRWFLGAGEVGDDWVARHVHRLVAISPPFGGSVQSLKAVVCGDHYIPNFHTEILDVLSRNTGIIACLPNRWGFDPAADILWDTEDGSRKLRIRDYGSLAEEGLLPFQIYRDLFLPHEGAIFRPCALDTHIITTRTNRTVVQYTSKRGFEYPRETETAPGDGVLSQRSLDAALAVFPGARVTVIPGATHSSLISHDRVIDIVRDAGCTSPRH